MATSDRLLHRRLADYARLMRVDRPIGTLLLAWPTLWGLWVAAHGRPDPWVLAVFLAGIFLMRSAGCVINDYADRGLDPHVTRTRNRPLATGSITILEAIGLFLVLSGTAFALVLTLNTLTVRLAWFGVAVAVVYPFMKRYTHLPQLVLGIAFSWGIPMAFAATTGSVPPVAWVLVGANVAWVVAYDTIYAMVDRDDDLRAGIRSTAILLGRLDVLAVAVLHGATLLILWGLGWKMGLNRYFYAGLAGAAASVVYQLVLIWHRDPARCFRAFLNNAWMGAAVFVGLVFAYLDPSG